jgi:hypothetical protein
MGAANSINSSVDQYSPSLGVDGYADVASHEYVTIYPVTIRSRFSWTEQVREAFERPLSPQSR